MKPGPARGSHHAGPPIRAVTWSHEVMSRKSLRLTGKEAFCHLLRRREEQAVKGSMQLHRVIIVHRL